MKKHIVSITKEQPVVGLLFLIFMVKHLVSGKRNSRQFFPQPGWVEHDPLEIVTTQIQCIKDAVTSAAIDPQSIACVGITNQRETTVVWERSSGKPIYPAIVWQCRRTQEMVKELEHDANLIRQKTGLIPDAYFSGPKVKWILDKVQGARKLADDGKLAFGTIDSWLIWNLSREKRHLTEPSNASRTMLFNINDLTWDNDLLLRQAVPEQMLPQVVSSNSNFGTTNKDLLGFAAPILSNLGDQQAALFGQCCFSEGMAKCTYGTGSFFLANIGARCELTPGLLTTVAWKLDQDTANYAHEGSIFISGAGLQWLRDGLHIIDTTDETEALAMSLPSNEGVYFVPAFVGLGSPWWNSDARGTIVGLTRGSGRAHLVRAALEAVAYQVSDVAESMANSGVKLSELRVDGGVTNNKFMLQFQSDLLGVPILRAAQMESTAWGVAALAALKANLISNTNELSAAWNHDFQARPKVDRSKEYAQWRLALKGAFAYTNTK